MYKSPDIVQVAVIGLAWIFPPSVAIKFRKPLRVSEPIHFSMSSAEKIEGTGLRKKKADMPPLNYQKHFSDTFQKFLVFNL
jgi:hypothetical protein